MSVIYSVFLEEEVSLSHFSGFLIDTLIIDSKLKSRSLFIKMAKELSLSQSIFGIDVNKSSFGIPSQSSLNVNVPSSLNGSIGHWKGGPLQTGTTIVSVKYKDGVILGADSRSSVSSTYVANRLTDKLQPLTDNIFIQRSGSSAHTQNVGDYVQHYLNNLSQELDEPPRVRTAGMYL